jgi:thiamine pyrophosphate-dependent acetolactate synthase large subunit-like protein
MLDSGVDVLEAEPAPIQAPATVAEAVARMFVELGVRHAFGVSGGAMAALWHALSGSQLAVRHFRHESGAAFAAVEAHFASDRPVVVFTTTGPGLTNALTGLLAARGEGAKVIVLSAATTAAQRGRWAIQETCGQTMPAGLYATGALFHFAALLESADELPAVARRLAHGLARPGGFVAHLAIPTGLQAAEWRGALPDLTIGRGGEAPVPETIAHCVRLLSDGPFAIWLGFGARKASGLVRRLAERTGAAVLCSPRAKGIFPEDHPQFVGVTGLGGHGSAITYMTEGRPRRVLVLGTRLGEATSFWSPVMVPVEGFIHVDVDPDVPGVAYPTAPTLAVRADVGAFLAALLEHLPEQQPAEVRFPRPERLQIGPAVAGAVRPEALMAAVQEVVVDRSSAVVLAESGNSFTWASHCLRFNEAGRYRVSTGIGSMGHAGTGVVGAAEGRGGKAVAILGDGAMLMNNEINTAVKFKLPAVWIVLNDARYNMCEQGMATLGLSADATIPEVDFAMLAQALGAEGLRVEREADLVPALERAMAAVGPFVLDVRIDPARRAPSHGRNRGLRAQLDDPAPRQAVSFPRTT